MNRTTAIVTSLLLATAVAACKKDDKKSDPTSTAKTTDKDKGKTGPAADPKPEPEPAKAAYSADEGKKLIGEMSTCKYDFDCKAYEALVGFGTAAGPELLAAVGDGTLTADHRKLIATALGALEIAEAGPKLVEVGNGIEDFIIQGDFYKAAGAAGGQATFDALIAEYAKAAASSDDDREVMLRGGLREFPAESVAWAKEKLPGAKDDAVEIVDLIADSAQESDKEALVALLAAAEDNMVKSRLARKLIELGDTAHFDVFIAGLSSDDVYDRSDAANMLADVVDKVPEELKPQLVELLTKGKAGDSGGMTSAGYDSALEKLGAK